MVAHYWEDKEKKLLQLTGKLYHFRKRLMRMNEERFVELNNLQHHADAMKSKYVDKVKELAAARTQIHSIERASQALKERMARKLSSKRSRVEEERTEEREEEGTSMKDDDLLGFMQVEDDERGNISGMPISVKLCNV